MRLRLASSADAPQVAEIYEPIVRDTAISFELVPPSPEEMAARIETTLQNHVWIVADDHSKIAGYAYAGKHRDRAAYAWSVDTTIYVRDSVRGKGVGRRLYRAVLQILSAQNYRMAFAGIALPNQASVALHESVGFKHLGTYPEVGFKFSQWHDVGWWSRPLTSRPTAEEILPLGKLKHLDDMLN